jgi:ribonucleotide reductase alpha subunit
LGANDAPAQEPAQKEEEESVLVVKGDGRCEPFDLDKLLSRLMALSEGLNSDFVDLERLAESVARGVYPNVTSAEINVLAAETAASMSTLHPDYARLAARICISQNTKKTPSTFSSAMELMDKRTGFIDHRLAQLVARRADEINARINQTRDMDMSYFGFKTLERAYLLKTDNGGVVERPQYLFMRVALGIHCCNQNETTLSEDEQLAAAFETYEMMSQGYFTHASPTLFHSGTTHPQLSSCFLVQMTEDSINGIYDTLKRCAVISKAAGGIGLSVHNIRARGTHIRGTRGVSNGLVPMLRVFDVTSRYVDQGGGKRPGAFAIYMEPWHADVFDVLNLKKNHGKEEQRARDLFYGLWVPNLFMQRVEENGVWSLMCPHKCSGLSETFGDAFRELYERYEREGRYVRQVRARELWGAILDAQIETGTPYLLYKDAANEKNNQKNLGTIQSSNLCTEIMQYTDKDEVAVCNLASM